MEEDGAKNNSRTITVAVILLIVFVLILILFLYLVRRPALFGSFAQTSETSSSDTVGTTPIKPQNVSLDNSYLFASPLKAAAAAEKIRITAYILDGQGMGVPGKTVVLGQNSSISVSPIKPLTDESGRAVFDVSSNSVGLFAIEASVDGKKINQRVTVSFE